MTFKTKGDSNGKTVIVADMGQTTTVSELLSRAIDHTIPGVRLDAAEKKIAKKFIRLCGRDYELDARGNPIGF